MKRVFCNPERSWKVLKGPERSLDYFLKHQMSRSLLLLPPETAIHWLLHQMSRMYYFILHLSIADLLTAFFSLIPEIIPAAFFPHHALPRGPWPGMRFHRSHAWRELWYISYKLISRDASGSSFRVFLAMFSRSVGIFQFSTEGMVSARLSNSDREYKTGKNRTHSLKFVKLVTS